MRLLNETGTDMEILLVEDNPGDVRLMIESFREADVLNRINTVEDGIEALQYLRREGRYAKANRPDIILLDLNLPRKDGREVLAEIKADESLRRIPVVVLTTSSAQEDILRAYDLHANCFVRKPVEFEKFINVVQAINSFWFSVASLPAGDERNSSAS